MAKGRELKGRIKSVENTRKITRTMEMVATSKMKRAQERVTAARPFATVLSDVISSLYSADLAERFPLLRQPATVRRAAVIVLTSNRGLAGGFNSNIIKEARNLIARLGTENVEVELHVVGRKGLGYFRYVGRKVDSSRTDIGLASEPNAHYVLVSTREHGNSDGPVEFRSYRIIDGAVTEEEVTVTDELRSKA